MKRDRDPDTDEDNPFRVTWDFDHARRPRNLVREWSDEAAEQAADSAAERMIPGYTAVAYPSSSASFSPLLANLPRSSSGSPTPTLPSPSITPTLHTDSDDVPPTQLV